MHRILKCYNIPFEVNNNEIRIKIKFIEKGKDAFIFGSNGIVLILAKRGKDDIAVCVENVCVFELNVEATYDDDGITLRRKMS